MSIVAERHLAKIAAAKADRAEAEAARRAAAPRSVKTPESMPFQAAPSVQPQPPSRLSLGQIHRDRHAAGAAAKTAIGTDLAQHTGHAASLYEQMLAKLYDDQKSLSSLQSLEAKIALKQQLLAGYAPWIDGVLAGGVGVEDEVFTTIMIWRIDAGDFDGAVPMAEFVLKHGMALPGRYERQPAVLIAEEIAEGANKLLDAGLAAPQDALSTVWLLTEDRDMPDQVRAKLEKAMGREFARCAEDPAIADSGMPGAARAYRQQALKHLRRAVELNDRIGVKTLIKSVEAAIAKEAE